MPECLLESSSVEVSECSGVDFGCESMCEVYLELMVRRESASECGHSLGAGPRAGLATAKVRALKSLLFDASVQYKGRMTSGIAVRA